MQTQRKNTKKSLTLLPTTVLGFVAIVFSYGCGHKNSVQVQPVSGEGQSRALEACGSKIGAAYEAIVKGDVEKKLHVVEICQVAETDDTRANDPVKYEVAQVPALYKVSRSGDKLVIKLRVELTVPSKTTDDDHNLIGQAIRGCAHKVMTQWSKSFEGKRSTLEIEPQVYWESSGRLVGNKIKLVNGPTKGSFVMDHWPTRGELYPRGLPGERENCPPLDAYGGQECHEAVMSKANDRFCAAFSIMSAYFLGLSADDALCGAKGNAADPKAAFVAQAFEHAGDPNQFREKARFTENDLKTVLTPVCANAKRTEAPDTRPIRVGGRRPGPVAENQ